MSDSISVQRNSQNEYQVKIRVENHLFSALIDTGMTQSDCLVGIGLDSVSYAVVRPYLRRFQRVGMEGVGPTAPGFVQAGLGSVSVGSLDDSEVDTYVAEIGENLVGVCYFQRLMGYEIIWDLEVGDMNIRKKDVK